MLGNFLATKIDLLLWIISANMVLWFKEMYFQPESSTKRGAINGIYVTQIVPERFPIKAVVSKTARYEYMICVHFEIKNHVSTFVI